MQKSIKHCLILGAGAIGSSLGFRLAQYYGDSIAVGAADGRAERYKKHGFIINGKSWFPRVETDRKLIQQPCDLLLVAVKYHQLKDILPLADQFTGPGTQILS
ncbi:MAG: hypothetical protein PF495_12270 [Spirochaetales bacterium]|jgi:2-dehydropantoate 2-reductase|nr:hypothetical protein [Spirochaetales bacterium]